MVGSPNRSGGGGIAIAIRIVILLLAALAGGWSSEATAGIAPPGHSQRVYWSAAAFYGTASYAMDTLNDWITANNVAFGSELVSTIESGTEYGGRLEFFSGSRWSVGFAATVFSAKTGYGPLPGTGYEVDIDAGGRCFELSVTRRVPLRGRARAGVSAALSRVIADGRISGVEELGYFTYGTAGSGWGASLHALFEYEIAGGTYLVCEGGVRRAGPLDVKNGGRTLSLPDGEKLTYSYSGAFVRAGLRITSEVLD